MSKVNQEYADGFCGRRDHSYTMVVEEITINKDRLVRAVMCTKCGNVFHPAIQRGISTMAELAAAVGQ